jgi:acetyltransferase-like isoleucine patch superfamily enzyme
MNSFLKQLIQTLKSIPWLVRWVRVWRQRQNEKQVSRWIRDHNVKGCAIDKRLTFTGHQDGRKYVHMGESIYMERDVTIWISSFTGADPQLSLGARTYVGQNTYLGVHYPIQTGKSVMIGAYSYIISANHRFARRDIPIQHQGFEGAPIMIEDEAWLGTHVVVLPGVKIGRGAIIGAGSVVTKDVPAWEIWGGVPARFIKVRPE